MTLILLSGRPGTGKTHFGQWLAQHRGFVWVEGDANPEWTSLLAVTTHDVASHTRDRATALGDQVVIEWGFPVRCLESVRLLRDAGFDAWWFDGEKKGARAGYIESHGDRDAAMVNYGAQTAAIDESLSVIWQFYGDHVVMTVTRDGRLGPEQVAAVVLDDNACAGH